MPSDPPELSVLLDIIAKEGLAPRESLTPESKLAELGIPSLEMINILFETDDLAGVVTVRDLMDLLATRLNPPKTPA